MRKKRKISAKQSVAYNYAFLTHEPYIKALFNGSLTPASGAKDKKGDVDSKYFRIECKATQKDSFPLKKDLLNDLEEAVCGTNKDPVISLHFLNERGQCDAKYVLLQESDFMIYKKQLEILWDSE